MNEYKIEIDGKVYLFGEKTEEKIIKIKKYEYVIRLFKFIIGINILITIFVIMFFCFKNKFIDSDLEYLFPSIFFWFISWDVIWALRYFESILVLQVMYDLSIIDENPKVFWLSKKSRDIRTQIGKNKFSNNDNK